MTARRPRLSPRQRWHELPRDRPKNGSTVAGVPAAVWTTLIELSRENETKDRFPGVLLGGSTAEEWSAHQHVILRYGVELEEALKTLAPHARYGRHWNAVKWGAGQRLLARTGRYAGTPYAEVTVVSRDCDAMRQFLTSASLGWFSRHPTKNQNPKMGPLVETTVEPTPWMAMVRRVMDMLDSSSDRRPFNQYTYRDLPLCSIGSHGVSMRRERALGNVRFRKWWGELTAGLPAKRAAAAPQPEPVS